jgi:type IV secretory pathway VirB2 component (pilin)
MLSIPENETSVSNPIFAASSWFQGALTGTVATTVAVLAIAFIGLLMLSGRIDVLRSARVILGCFIIFGASTIAAGIHAAITAGDSAPSLAEIDPPPYYPHASPAVPQSVPAATDPYAGAAVPRR